MNKLRHYIVLTALTWFFLNSVSIFWGILAGDSYFPLLWLRSLDGFLWIADDFPEMYWLYAVLALALILWFRKPNVMTAGVLTVVGTYVGPLGYFATGGWIVSVPFSCVVLLGFILLQGLWTKVFKPRLAKRKCS